MASPRVRLPAAAGRFYPADPSELAASVRAYLDLGSSLAAGVVNPKAVIVPHAGYVYSGPVAGTAFAPLAGLADEIRRVVLLGPAHRVPLRGLGLASARAFRTPLGEVPTDGDLEEEIKALPQVSVRPDAHQDEHSLEVELPFLQLLFGDFTILPIVIGQATADEVAGVLEAVWGGPETRIVVSSDLSHYLAYEDAIRADRKTAERILAFEPDLSPYDACGCFSVNGLVEAGRRKGLRCELLDLRNSGDTAGDRDRVVGYGAFSFFE